MSEISEQSKVRVHPDNTFGINPWVKWLFLAASLIQALYFVVWLMIQTDVIDHQEMALSMVIHLSSRFLLTVLATILLLRCTIWQIKVSSWIVTINRVIVLLLVIPAIRESYHNFLIVPEVAFYFVLVTDFLLLTSKVVRLHSIWPLLILLLLDLVTLAMSIFNIDFSDLLMFWLYSELMAICTGVALFFFYRGIEKNNIHQ